MTWLLLSAAILSEVAASLSLKGSESNPALFVVVVVGYVAAFVFLTAVLKRGLALGAAYGIWGASGVALTAILSSLIFDEAFTLTMGAGLVLVIAGVLLVETGSRRDEASTPEMSQ
ncbi:DMT family transporter [Nocardia neocaledoniensis]|uniref:DMT family transporter n=1 Tax=Nocardia neocaledoniensis TaxID=236511 RepID=UPI00245642BE|nr:SMR family transporter [Nocardia neocaledoniensis]